MSAVRVCKFHQIFAVFGFSKLFTETMELVYIYPALAPGNLFDTAHAEALTVLDGGDKIAGFQQAVAIAGVEPGKATAEELHFQRALVQIETVEVGNFVFAASRGLQGGGFLCHGGVVEVQSGDGIVAFRIGRLFMCIYIYDV